MPRAVSTPTSTSWWSSWWGRVLIVLVVVIPAVVVAVVLVGSSTPQSRAEAAMQASNHAGLAAKWVHFTETYTGTNTSDPSQNQVVTTSGTVGLTKGDVTTTRVSGGVTQTNEVVVDGTNIYVRGNAAGLEYWLGVTSDQAGPNANTWLKLPSTGELANTVRMGATIQAHFLTYSTGSNNAGGPTVTPTRVASSSGGQVITTTATNASRTVGSGSRTTGPASNPLPRVDRLRFTEKSSSGPVAIVTTYSAWGVPVVLPTITKPALYTPATSVGGG